MSYPFPGKSAAITIGGTAKPLDTFEISVDGDPIDFTNFTSGGWAEVIGGVKSADITASGPYNGLASAGAAGDPVGTAVAFVLTYGGTGPVLTLTALLANAKISTDIKGIAKINYTAKSSGMPTLAY